MSRLLALLLAATLWLGGAGAARAEPISAALTAFGTWFAAQTIAVQIGLRLVAAVALSLLSRRKLQAPKNPGIQAQFTTSGGTESQKTILGRFATHGHRVYHNSHGDDRVLYTRIIELGDLPGVTVRRVFVGGEDIAFDLDNPLEDGRIPALGIRRTKLRYNFLSEGDDLFVEDVIDNAWLIWFDGTQTAASSWATGRYSGRDNYAWTNAHVLSGIPYAIVDLRGNPKLFSGIPELRFEVDGIPLYDPRQDSSIGGAGSQRWSDPSTWAQTVNPIVIVYNILRGISLADGRVWGGEAESAEDLPLATWAAAMNVCDEQVVEGEVSRPRYTAGIEVSFTEPPADAIEELLDACNGQIAELGGVYEVQVGAPEAAVLSISDDDILVSAPHEFDPFPSFDDIHNGASITHPSPEALWNGRELEPVLFPDLEAEDGGRALYDLRLTTCFDPNQARQVAKELVLDGRRFRQHVFTLPPAYFYLTPLRTIAWTSLWNSYTDKDFEIGEVVYDLATLTVQVSVRERDPSDFEYQTGLLQPQLPYAPVAEVIELPVIPGLAVDGVILKDASGLDRRPAIRVRWDGPALVDTFQAVAIEARLFDASALAFAATHAEVETGVFLVQDVLPAEVYQVRVRPVARTVDADWSDWISVATPDVRLSEIDIADALNAKVNAAFERHDQALEDVESGTIRELLDSIAVSFGALQSPDAPQLEPTLSDQIALERERLDLQVSRVYDAEGVQDDILQSLMDLSEAQFATDTVIRDAGIYVSPEDGTVKITAVEYLENRYSDVQFNLDAVESELQLRATVAYVNQALAEAVLDPSQIPLLDDITLRLSNAEATISAEEAQVQLLTDTLTVEGGLVTMNTVTAELDSLNNALELRVTSAEFDDVEARLTAAEVTLTALPDNAAITQSVEASRIIGDDLADGQQLSIVEAWERFTGDEAIKTAEAQAREDLRSYINENDEAISERVTLLDAEVASSRAQIEQRLTTQASETEALASSLTQTQADIADPETGLLATAETLDETVSRVALTEDGLAAAAESRTFLLASVREGEEWDEAQIAAAWNNFSELEGAKLGVAVALREQKASVTEGLAAEASGRLLLGAALEDARAVIREESRARVTADRAITEQVTELEASLEDTERGQTATAQALDAVKLDVYDDGAGLAATASRVDEIEVAIEGDGETPGLSARVSSTESAIVDEATGLSATASRVDEIEVVLEGDGEAPGLSARVTSAENAIIDETTGLSATASRVDGLEVAIEGDGETPGLSAQVAEIQGAYVDADEAVAAVEEKISASYGDLTAMAEATAFAKATADGISSGYVWRLNGANVMELVAVEDGTGGAQVTATIDADYVRITGLTQIDDAVITALVADEAFLGNLEVDTINIKESAILPAQISYGAVGTGKLATDAATVYGVAGSGAVSNNSGTPTDVCSLTLNTALVSGLGVLGQAQIRLDDVAGNYPSGFEINAFVGGVKVAEYVYSSAQADPTARVVNMPLSRTGISVANPQVILRIRNMGGKGILSANVWALARKR